MQGTKLNLTAEEIRSLGGSALEFVAEYLERLPEMRIAPSATSAELRAVLGEPLPRAGMDGAALLAVFRDAVAKNVRHNGHPRFFGYVSSPGTAIGAIAELLTGALNANVTAWRSAPAAAEVEHLTIGWLKELFGYPPDALGLLVSGGSMANFSALAAARAAKPGVALERMRVYASSEAHFSMRKAAGLLGIGPVRVIATDARLRMDGEQLRAALREDAAAGLTPVCVVASAGTASTGAFDPLVEIGEAAREAGAWFHVDGAYGGFAVLAPSARPLFAGIERADSLSLDPHKWAYLPPGTGCVLYRQPEFARRAFSEDADYTRVIGHEQNESFAFWDYGPELSRPFRALGLWMLLKFVGADELGRAIEQNIECAQHLARLVAASSDFEMLAPVGLSIFCFRYAPPGFTGDLDTLNREVMLAVQREGSSYVSNTTVRGCFALRGCVLNHRTTARDMEILLEDVRRAASAWWPR